MGLFEILGRSREDLQSVGEYLRDFYVENKDEKARIAHACMLDEFYAGRGDVEMERVIDLLWADKKNRDRRKAVLKAGLDKYDNVLARIAQEKATVYNEPTQRKVDNASNDKYQAFLDLLPQDAIMRELDTKLAIHEEALLWYRVRMKPTGEREPVLEVVSPASFWAICHPNDRTLLVGIIMDQRMPMANEADPSFRVWTDDETFLMNAKCQIFELSIEKWQLGEMPGVLCSMREPSTKTSLLAPCPSIDLLSAQKAVRLQDLNLAKESISVSRQNYVTGDTSATAMGQSADTDGEVFLGEGVTVSSVDRGVDTEQFRDNAAHAADSAGANHGVPPAVRSQKDASSGAEIEMRRIPIRELRKKRIPVFRRIEARTARIMALVNGGRDGVPGDLPEYAFDPVGWSMDFGEVQQPLTEAEQDQVFEKRRQLGLTNTVDEIKRRNPDIRNDVDAMAILQRNVEMETDRVALMKNLLALSGSMGTETPDHPRAQDGTPVPARGGTDTTEDGQ